MKVVENKHQWSGKGSEIGNQPIGQIIRRRQARGSEQKFSADTKFGKMKADTDNYVTDETIRISLAKGSKTVLS